MKINNDEKKKSTQKNYSDMNLNEKSNHSKNDTKKTVSIQEKSAALDVEMNEKKNNKCNTSKNGRHPANVSSLALRALCLCVFITLFFSLSRR